MQKVFIVSVFLHKIHCISIYIYIILQVSHRCVGPRVEIYIRSRPSLFFFFFFNFLHRQEMFSLSERRLHKIAA